MARNTNQNIPAYTNPIYNQNFDRYAFGQSSTNPREVPLVQKRGEGYRHDRSQYPKTNRPSKPSRLSKHSRPLNIAGESLSQRSDQSLRTPGRNVFNRNEFNGLSRSRTPLKESTNIRGLENRGTPRLKYSGEDLKISRGYRGTGASFGVSSERPLRGDMTGERIYNQRKENIEEPKDYLQARDPPRGYRGDLRGHSIGDRYHSDLTRSYVRERRTARPEVEKPINPREGRRSGYGHRTPEPNSRSRLGGLSREDRFDRRLSVDTSEKSGPLTSSTLRSDIPYLYSDQKRASDKKTVPEPLTRKQREEAQKRFEKEEIIRSQREMNELARERRIRDHEQKQVFQKE